MRKQRFFIFSSIFALLLSSLQVVLSQSDIAMAADERKFNPELIISDSIFRDDGSMTSSQIQKFLEKKNSACLKNKQVLSLHDSNRDGLGDEPYGLGKNNKVRVSSLIAQASRLYDISPRVILATLEKEQGLVTRQDCPEWRYNSALGYGCPDTAPCDNSAYGFTRQIDYGTWHFQGFYLDTFPVPPTVPGKKKIFYNPGPCKVLNSNGTCKEWYGRYKTRADIEYCGGTTLNIRNRATAALYSYTPYQPNAATLAAEPGQTVRCGAYGNLNFWRYFTDWFGSTMATLDFKPMNEPRYLRLEKDLAKTNFRTGDRDGVTLPKGMEIYFTTSYEYNGQLYVRTESDTKKQLERGIRYSDLMSSLGIKSMSAPRDAILRIATPKINFRTGKSDGVTLPKYTRIFFNNSYTYKGELYLRTKADTDKWLERGIRYSDLLAPLRFEPMKKARYLRLEKDIAKTNLRTGSADGVVLKKDTSIYFTTSYVYKGELYVRTEVDTRKKLERGIRYSDLL